MKLKRYNSDGHYGYKVRVHPRRQLEQWRERRSVVAELEQRAREHEYEYRVPGGQELPLRQAPWGVWLWEWAKVTAAPSARLEDLPFVVSGVPQPKPMNAVNKNEGLERILGNSRASASAAGGKLWIS